MLDTARDPDSSALRPTPMMEQYTEIKAAYPDSLLFYRMGDFYELFFGDAEIASRALGITLTKRGKHLGQDIPMCGVPIHAANDYLQKLIALGHRVAVCEQVEDPAEARKRGNKTVVRRDVVRLVTPGTITEETLLESGRNNYLAVIARTRSGTIDADRFAIAWIDISTGDFRLAETDPLRLSADIARIDPSELLVPDSFFAEERLGTMVRNLPLAPTPLPGAFFDGATAAQRLGAYYGVSTLDGIGSFSRVELVAASAALAYVEKTQIGERPPLARPQHEADGDVMLIDAATRANLELSRTLAGERRGSLLGAIDRTITGAGSRLLAERLASPSTDPALIEARLDAVAFFLADAGLRLKIGEALRVAPDLARAFSRLSVNRGGPRDLAAIRFGLDAARRIGSLLRERAPPAEIGRALTALEQAPADLAEELAGALAEDLPLLKRDGGFVRSGYDGDLDETRALRDESRQVIAGLQATYASETDIRGLKIKHNNVLGFFIEVAQQHGERLLGADFAGRYIHRQTMAGAMRFITTELAELEAKIASAGDRALALELATFEALVAHITAAGAAIRAAANALAAIDVGNALAVLADSENYCRPIVDRSLAFSIEAGRHPVVEQALRRDGGPAFVPNGCDLGAADESGAGRIWLITGPNMAGKSTFLRQNGLIAILAQIGSFVPALAAHIGLVDRLFSRVGAADDLARGRSTFMVEMVETAAILNQATDRSVVILDEIGRGTATFDGLSIAWAAIEHLHDVNRSRGLFATHYHELTALAQRLSRLENATVKVKEWNGDVVFLHEIVAGSADRSYGIQVAKLAGLPAAVVARARDVLSHLEETDRKSPTATLIDDLPLFAAAAATRPAPAPLHDPLGPVLDDLRPDDMTPRDALEALYRLKALRAETVMVSKGKAV